MNRYRFIENEHLLRKGFFEITPLPQEQWPMIRDMVSVGAISVQTGMALMGFSKYGEALDE